MKFWNGAGIFNTCQYWVMGLVIPGPKRLSALIIGTRLSKSIFRRRAVRARPERLAPPLPSTPFLGGAARTAVARRVRPLGPIVVAISSSNSRTNIPRQSPSASVEATRTRPPRPAGSRQQLLPDGEQIGNGARAQAPRI